MEVEDGLAQLSRRGDQRGVGPRQRRVGRRLGCLLELVSGGEEVLDRVVVERLRERLALALLGLEGVRQESRAVCGETRRELGTTLEQQGKLTHARAQCPDREGPREIEMWEPQTGWRKVSARR